MSRHLAAMAAARRAASRAPWSCTSPVLARRCASSQLSMRSPILAALPLDRRQFSTSNGSAPAVAQLDGGVEGLAEAAAAVVGSAEKADTWAVVQGVQAVLETVHETTGLPWWATLMASGVGLRAALFPFYVYQIRATQRLVQARPDFAKLYSAFKYARTFLPPNDRTAHLQAILLGRKGMKAVMKKYNTRPVQTVLGSLAYIPMFAIVGYSARDMIRSGNFAGMDVGGFLFWQNLMETDATFVLPALAMGSTYLNLELSVRNKSGFWTTLLQGGQYLTLLALPVVSTIPQGIFFYWLGASWASMAQTIAMSNNAFRKRIGLKPRIVAPAPPAPSPVDNETAVAEEQDTAAKK